MKNILSYEEFLNEERIKNVLDLENELKSRNIFYTEIDKKDKFVWVVKNGKKKIATFDTGPKWLNIIEVPIVKEKQPTTELDYEIHNLLSDWVISSLDDYTKRDSIVKKLMKLDIPEKYKTVNSKFLYRLISVDDIPKGTFKLSTEGSARSWAYHPFGVEKMKDWYLDIYGSDKIKNMIIVKKPVSNVIINIPEFYNTHEGLLHGKKHSSLIFSEYEVICENKEPLISVKANEWEITKL